MNTTKLNIKFPLPVLASAVIAAAFTQSVMADGRATPFNWHQIANLPGGQSAGATAIIDGRVYLAGGRPPGGSVSPWVVATARVYDPASNTWTALPPMSHARYNGGPAVLTAPDGGAELYVVGGYSGYTGLSVVERYVVKANTWQTVASLDSNRGEGVVVAVVNNSIYAIGGQPNFSDYKTTNQKYDRANNAWSVRAPAPQPVGYALAATYQNRIYLFGGASTGGTSVLSTLIYDTQSDSWTTGANLPRARNLEGAAVVFNEQIYLVGGVYSTSTDEQRIIDVYDPASNAWAVAGNYPFDNILNLPGQFNRSAAGPGGMVCVLGTGSADLRCYSGFLGGLDLKMFAGLVIDGQIGAKYDLEYATTLSPANWARMTTVTLTTQPFVWIDYDSATASSRFYRASLVP